MLLQERKDRGEVQTEVPVAAGAMWENRQELWNCQRSVSATLPVS